MQHQRQSLLGALFLAAVCAILVATLVSPEPALAYGNLRANTGSAHQVRTSANNVWKALGRGRAKRATQQRRAFLAGNYHNLVGELLAGYQTLVANDSLTPVERVRTIGAIARMILRAEQTVPGTHAPDVLDHAHRLLAQARTVARTANHETAVELELRMRDVILDSFTTETGTVGPILDESGVDAPSWLVDLANGSDVHSVPWDKLSRSEKHELLRQQCESQDFFENRRIPGIRFRKQIRFTRGDGFLTEEELPLSGYVEHFGPTSVAHISGIEAHVRQHGAASRTLANATHVRDAFANDSAPTHQHITTHLSPELLRGDDIERIGLVDFYRRVNVVAEMHAVLGGSTLSPNIQGNIVYFDFLQADDLGVLNSHLEALAHGNPYGGIYDHSQLKMAAVGFRTGELYNNERIFGFEARTLSRNYGGANGRFVDAVQRGLIGRHYGISRTKYAQWRARQVRGLETYEYTDAENAAFTALHYTREPEEMLQSLPHGLVIDDATRARVLELAASNYSVRMLVQDWSNDPVVDGDPELITRITMAQQRGLYKLTHANDWRQGVQQFLIESGLFERFTQSIGMETAADAAE